MVYPMLEYNNKGMPLSNEQKELKQFNVQPNGPDKNHIG